MSLDNFGDLKARLRARLGLVGGLAEEDPTKEVVEGFDGKRYRVPKGLTQAEIDELQKFADDYMQRARLFKQLLRPQSL